MGRALEIAGYEVSPALALGLDAVELDLEDYPERVHWLEVATGDPPELAPAARAKVARWARRREDPVARRVGSRHSGKPSRSRNARRSWKRPWPRSRRHRGELRGAAVLLRLRRRVAAGYRRAPRRAGRGRRARRRRRPAVPRREPSAVRPARARARRRRASHACDSTTAATGDSSGAMRSFEAIDDDIRAAVDAFLARHASGDQGRAVGALRRRFGRVLLRRVRPPGRRARPAQSVGADGCERGLDLPSPLLRAPPARAGVLAQARAREFAPGRAARSFVRR